MVGTLQTGMYATLLFAQIVVIHSCFSSPRVYRLPMDVYLFPSFDWILQKKAKNIRKDWDAHKERYESVQSKQG